MDPIFETNWPRAEDDVFRWVDGCANAPDPKDGFLHVERQAEPPALRHRIGRLAADRP